MKHKLKRKPYGILNGIMASVSYGTNPLFTLPLFHAGIGVNSVLFYRYIFATIIYFIWLKFFKKVSLKINLKEACSLFFMAILFSLSSLTLFSSFIYIDSGIACTILFVYPIIVAFISWLFFKEKQGKTVFLAIIITTLGIYLLHNQTGNEVLNPKGVSLVLLSAFSYALYIVGVKNIKTIKKIKSDKLSFYIMLFGLTVYVYNLKFCTELQILNNWFLWLCVILLAILPTIISLETITTSIKLVGPTITAVLGALEPITAIFFGVLVFHEALNLTNVFGILLVLFGVILIIIRKMKK